MCFNLRKFLRTGAPPQLFKDAKRHPPVIQAD